MTTKQEYRPVTTKEGIVLLVDENINAGNHQAQGIYYNKDVDVISDKGYYLHPSDVLIICQPIESKLDGIAYYQTEEENAWASQWEKDNAIHPQCINPHAYRLGFLAAKAREFTEEHVRKAYFANDGDWLGDAKDDEVEFNEFITSLRKPRRIVSATPVMEEGCIEGHECRCIAEEGEKLEWCPHKTKTKHQVTYTLPEHPGKTFLKLDIKYE